MHLKGQALCCPLLPSLAWVTRLPPLPAASCCCPRSPVMHAPPCPLLPLASAADCLCLARPALHFHLKATGPESSEFGLFLRFFFGTTRSFLSGTSGKEPTCQCRRRKRCRFDLSVSRIPWRRAWQPTPVFLPGESPWTEEPDGLQSMGSQRVRQERSDQVCAVPVKPHDSRPAVLNLLVTRGRIHGRRFFYGRGRGRGMVSEWFKCIAFIVHFLSTTTTSTSPQIIRH